MSAKIVSKEAIKNKMIKNMSMNSYILRLKYQDNFHHILEKVTFFVSCFNLYISFFYSTDMKSVTLYLFLAIMIEIFNTTDFYIRGIILGQIKQQNNQFFLLVSHTLSGPVALLCDIIIYYNYRQISILSLILRTFKCLTTDSGYTFFLDLKEMIKLTS